jgi:hypothetical protein
MKNFAVFRRLPVVVSKAFLLPQIQFILKCRETAKFRLTLFKICYYLTVWAAIAQSVSDWLRDGRSGDRIPLVARFSAHFQTGPGTHTASYTLGTGSFPGLKRPGHGVDHSPHQVLRLKKE